MELQTLVTETLARIVQRLDPLVLMVDLNGRVIDRSDCTNDRLPPDLRCADALGAVLSAPVLTEWRALLRESLARREGIGSMAIIDGRGHALAISPSGGPGAIAMVAIFPHTLCTGSHPTDSAIRQVELMNHEWGRLDCLSRGQLDTLRSVTMGFSNDRIAERVHRTKRAIEWHIRFLNQLLGLNGREELAAIGREAGLCCFSDEGWAGVMRTRPSRRDSGSPEMPEPKPLRVA